MEALLNYICEHAGYAHYIIFGLLILTGFNVPISEELVLLTAGALGSSCEHESHMIVKMYIWTYMGCWLGAWIAYWIGRLLGPKLFEFRWCRYILSPQRLEKLKGYLHRFGIWTFIIGRFIPGGVRNAIFMSSGLIQMPFRVFILRDAVGCFCASITFFYVGHLFGENYHGLIRRFAAYEEVFLGLIVLLAVSFILYIYLRSRKTENIKIL